VFCVILYQTGRSEKLSQNIIVKTTPSKTLLSLNMRNVSQLFPGFTEGDFAVALKPPLPRFLWIERIHKIGNPDKVDFDDLFDGTSIHPDREFVINCKR
jgi:hypothetical protein